MKTMHEQNEKFDKEITINKQTEILEQKNKGTELKN